MKYQLARFTVPKGQRDPDNCSHDWLDPKKQCVFCGTDRSTVELVFVPRFKWCCNCRKRARISYNGKDYCAQCLNKHALVSRRDARKPEAILVDEAILAGHSTEVSNPPENP